jgi:hypothetical protein
METGFPMMGPYFKFRDFFLCTPRGTHFGGQGKDAEEGAMVLINAEVVAACNNDAITVFQSLESGGFPSSRFAVS